VKEVVEIRNKKNESFVNINTVSNVKNIKTNVNQYFHFKIRKNQKVKSIYCFIRLWAGEILSERKAELFMKCSKKE
jgi:hypothetical protein